MFRITGTDELEGEPDAAALNPDAHLPRRTHLGLFLALAWRGLCRISAAERTEGDGPVSPPASPLPHRRCRCVAGNTVNISCLLAGSNSSVCDWLLFSTWISSSWSTRLGRGGEAAPEPLSSSQWTTFQLLVLLFHLSPSASNSRPLDRKTRAEIRRKTFKRDETAFFHMAQSDNIQTVPAPDLRPLPDSQSASSLQVAARNEQAPDVKRTIMFPGL